MSADASDIFNDKRTDLANELAVKYNAVVFGYIAFVIITGIVGNSFTFIYHGFVESRTVTSFLIAALAANDFLTSVSFIGQIVVVRHLINLRSRFVCQFVRFLNNFFIVNSLIFLNPIGIERCLKVCVSNHRFHMSRKKAGVTIVSLTLYSFLMAVRQFPISDINNVKVFVPDNSTVIGHICALTKEADLFPVVVISNFFDSCSFIVTNIVIVIVYSAIARKVTKVRQRVNAYPIVAQGSRTASSSAACRAACETNETYLSSEEKKSVALREQNLNIFYVNKIAKSVVKTNSESLNTKFTDTDRSRDIVSKVCSSVESTSCSKHTFNYNMLTENVPHSTNTHPITGVCCCKQENSKNNIIFTADKRPVRNVKFMDAGSSDIKVLKGKSLKVQENQVNVDTSLKFQTAKRRSQTEKKINIMLAALTFSSVLCHVPYFMTLAIARPGESPGEYAFNPLIQILWKSVLLSSSINPVILIIFNTNFRKFVKSILLRQ